MIYFTDETLDRFIKEDVPYIDLTTQVLGIGEKQGHFQIFSREEATICGTEEVARIFSKLGLVVLNYLPTGSQVNQNETIFEAKGKVGSLHMAWKVGLNILEHSSGIATRTRRMVNLVERTNPKAVVVTTRKNFPGTKELAIKAVIAGGGYPHRLGLCKARFQDIGQ